MTVVDVSEEVVSVSELLVSAATDVVSVKEADDEVSMVVVGSPVC